MDKKVYISGPITNVANAQENFKKAEDYLKSMGYEPLNPFDCEPVRWEKEAHIPETEQYNAFMRGDLVRMLLECDTIFMLSGWERSRGAQLELFVATFCGFTVSFSFKNMLERRDQR